MERIIKKVAFCTLGCKVNQYETNAMIQEFMLNGYEIVEFNEVSDIYVINTCTVTNIADKKSRQMIRKVKELNHKAILVAVGCYAQVGKEELEKIKEIDLILGNNEKKDILKYIEQIKSEKVKEIQISDVFESREYLEYGEVTYTDKTRAVIKVQDGCDRFCSYCIIPYARGRVRSREKESIISEITKVANNGIKEIVITGIHIASYGKDLKNEYKLIDLLEDINKVPGLERIRIGSLEPTIVTKDFCDRLKNIEKMCNHFHLSLQSGCDETLKRMNRKYTTKEFEEAVKNLRNIYSNVALTTDIIVGFPGETEEEFEETVKYLEKIRFYMLHIFKYSPKKGTPAATMKQQVDGNIKDIRSKILQELSYKNQSQINENQINSEVEVLFEEEIKIDKDIYFKGHTKNYIVVKVKSKENISGKILKCKIIKQVDMELFGEII